MCVYIYVSSYGTTDGAVIFDGQLYRRARRFPQLARQGRPRRAREIILFEFVFLDHINVRTYIHIDTVSACYNCRLYYLIYNILELRKQLSREEKIFANIPLVLA